MIFLSSVDASKVQYLQTTFDEASVKKNDVLFLGFFLITFCLGMVPVSAATSYVRVNQVGYLTTDTKVAIAFSNSSLSGLTFSIVRVSDSATVWGPTTFPAS